MELRNLITAAHRTGFIPDSIWFAQANTASPGANVTSIPDIAIHILLRPSLAVRPCDLNVRLHSIDHCYLPDADDATVGNEETFTIALVPKHSYPRTCSQSEANDTSVNIVDLPASRAIRATRHWQCVHCMTSP